MNYARILIFLLVTVGALGCSTKATQQTELTVWLDTNDQEMRFFKRVSHQIAKELPHIRLRLRFLPFDDLKPRFQGQVGETREPDILYLMNDWIGELVEQNLLRPLDLDLSTVAPQAVSSMRYQKKIYGAPFVFQTLAMVYNRKQIPEPPRHFAEIEKLAQQTPKNHFPLIYDQRNFYYHAPWFHACGGQVFNAAGRFVLQPEPLYRSLAWARNLQTRGFVPKQASYSAMLNLFSSGQTPFMITGPWSLSLIDGQDIDYGVAPLPQNECGKEPQAFIGVKGFGLNQLSPHPEAAEEVMAYFVSHAIQEQALKEIDNLPVDRNLLESALPAHKQVFYQQLKQGIPMPNHPLMREVWQEMNWLLNQVFDGQSIPVSVEQSIKRLREKAKTYAAA